MIRSAMRTSWPAASSLRSSVFGPFLSPDALCPSAENPEIREVIVGPFRVVYRHRSGMMIHLL